MGLKNTHGISRAHLPLVNFLLTYGTWSMQKSEGISAMQNIILYSK